MHHFLPLERLASDSRGDHYAQVCGKGGGAQSYPAPVEGSDPAQSGGDRSGVGRGVESAPCGCGDSFSSFDARNPRAFAQFTVRQFLRRAPLVIPQIVLALIRFYQFFVSPLLPPSCRFVPTCSAYAYEAVQKWGVGRGTWYALRRLVRCHPLGGHGYDPVP
jgi:putative membrane protein insertion efficiency factor